MRWAGLWGPQQGLGLYSKGLRGHEGTKQGSGRHLHRGSQRVGRNLDSEVKKGCFPYLWPLAVNPLSLSIICIMGIKPQTDLKNC